MWYAGGNLQNSKVYQTYSYVGSAAIPHLTLRAIRFSKVCLLPEALDSKIRYALQHSPGEGIGCAELSFAVKENARKKAALMGGF